MCIYTCNYVYIYIYIWCMYACMYVCICMYMYVYVCVCVCVCVCICICMCMCMYMYMYMCMCMCVCVYVCMCVCMYVCMYVHMSNMCVYVPVGLHRCAYTWKSERGRERERELCIYIYTFNHIFFCVDAFVCVGLWRHANIQYNYKGPQVRRLISHSTWSSPIIFGLWGMLPPKKKHMQVKIN